MGTIVLAESDKGPKSQVGDKALNVASEKSKASTSVFWDNVMLKLASKNEKKAEIALKIAEKKAAHSEDLAEKGKSEEAKEKAEEHKEALDKAEKYLDKVAVDGDVNEVKNALRATIMMEKKLEAHRDKFVEGHSKILERQKARMSEEKITHLTEVFSKIETRTAEAKDRIEQKQENLIARYKILTGATDEEVDALMAELEAEVEAKFQK